MPRVNIHEAKTHLSRLLNQTLSGQDVIIANAGKAIARIVPLENHIPRKLGLGKGCVAKDFFEPFSKKNPNTGVNETAPRYTRIALVVDG